MGKVMAVGGYMESKAAKERRKQDDNYDLDRDLCIGDLGIAKAIAQYKEWKRSAK
jgi:hypothetical protein